MKTIGLMTAISVAISTLVAPATADPWKDESGHGRWGGYEHKKEHWKPKRHHHRKHRRERSNFGIYFESRPAYRYQPAPEYRSAGNAHVEWCYSRYRSYDVRTDTFQPYDGPRRYCNSPYR